MSENCIDPVTNEKQITGDVVPGKVLAGHRMGQHDAQSNDGKIERPYTQDAAGVEQAERDAARNLNFPEQEGGNQESA